MLSKYLFLCNKIKHLRNFDATSSGIWVPCTGSAPLIRYRHVPCLEEEAREEETVKTKKKSNGMKNPFSVLSSTVEPTMRDTMINELEDIFHPFFLKFYEASLA